MPAHTPIETGSEEIMSAMENVFFLLLKMMINIMDCPFKWRVREDKKWRKFVYCRNNLLPALKLDNAHMAHLFAFNQGCVGGWGNKEMGEKLLIVENTHPVKMDAAHKAHSLTLKWVGVHRWGWVAEERLTWCVSGLWAGVEGGTLVSSCWEWVGALGGWRHGKHWLAHSRATAVCTRSPAGNGVKGRMSGCVWVGVCSLALWSVVMSENQT